MDWIQVSPHSPYFEDESGHSWTPIGQNDAISWPDLAGAFCRRDLPSVETYFATLAQHKITCVRLMLEYCHGEHRYLEWPAGYFQPNMVRLWDDIFALCEKYQMRILLTPYDTYWMWVRWARHPYNQKNGGPCEQRSRWLLCPQMRAAIKNRLEFATTRWGGSGALFAWDIWNEIHPAHAEDSASVFDEFVSDISGFLRDTEQRLYGRTHPQTVSVFGPVLEDDTRVADCIFRHPALDFASIHFYEKDTIDHPQNTVDAALSMGKLTRSCLGEIHDGRPFFDSEHGPIHGFKDRRITLPDAFDDEYFRHLQWAHFASGGAGGGMRWPNRHPHTLTPGMRRAQRALADFLPLINWHRFQRRNLNPEIRVSASNFAAFGCGDSTQALVWLLRTDGLNADGTLRRDLPAVSLRLQVPQLKNGRYHITAWNTLSGSVVTTFEAHSESSASFETPPVTADLALAIRRVA